MALTKEELIKQGLSEEQSYMIISQFNNEAKQIRESLQKREDVVSREEYLKLSSELDELKAFKDIPSTKIEDIKTNLNKINGNSLTEKVNTLKELKPDLFIEEPKLISPTNIIKEFIEKSQDNKEDEIEKLKEKGAYTPDEIKKISEYTLKNLK